jgi:thioredoxin-like negative regulator of GroEL
MKPKIVKITLLLLVSALVAVVVPVCGCSNTKKATTQNTTPSTAPQETAPQPQNTTPVTQGEPSPSEAAIAQAKAEGKPVMVKFGSGKCIPCKQIEENINSVKPEYEGKAAFVIVDVYDMREQNLTNQFGIQTIPTSFFINKDGKVVNSIVGVMDPAQIKQQIDSML